MAFASLLPRIEPEDRRPLLAAAVGFMCVGVASLLVRIAGDTLFLSAYGRDTLAFLYLGTAVIVSLLAFLFGVFAGRIPLARLIVASAAFLVVITLATRFALESEVRVFRLAAYLLADLTINGTMLLFWSFFARLFPARKAKRCIGIVGAGGTLACLLAAMSVGSFNAWFGSSNLLFVVAALVAAFGFIVHFALPLPVSPTEPHRRAAERGRQTHRGYRLTLLQNPNIRRLVLLVSIATITITLVDFQFKAAAQAAFDSQALPAFFGQFYAAANVMVLVTQLLLVTWLLRRGGLLLCLCLLPGALFVTSIWTLLGSEFVGIIASRFVVQIMVFTIDTAALHVLYLGVRKQSYSQARAFVDGICKPVAMGLAGSFLFFGTSLIGLRGLACFGIVAAGLWLVVARLNYRTYLAALLEGLRAKLIYPGERFEGAPDQSVERYARERLLDAPPEDLPYLLTIMGDFEDIDLTPELRLLLAREEPEIKVAALEKLRDGVSTEDLGPVLAHRDHPEPAVRRAAIVTASVLRGTEVTRALLSGLEDTEPDVRAEAAVALMQLGDLNGLMRGVEALKELMDSPIAAYRRAVARPLAKVELAGRHDLMRSLLEDDDSSVRKAALEACVKAPDPRLVSSVLPHLRDPELSAIATDVLVAVGEETITHLESLPSEALSSQVEQAPVLLLVLVKIGGPSALAIVHRLIDETRLTPGLTDCYRRLVRNERLSNGRDGKVVKMLRNQLDSLGRRRSQLKSSIQIDHAEFFCQALEDAIEDHLQNIFLLLEILVEGVDMQVLRRKVHSDQVEERSQALDVLESLLPSFLRWEVLEAVDPARVGIESLADPLAETISIENASPVLAGAVYAACLAQRIDLAQSIEKLLYHASPLCRETALYAVNSLTGSPRVLNPTATLKQDTAPAVRRLALAIEGGEGEGIPMITVERVLFLRHVPLFAHMKSSELSALAQITQEEVFPAGSEIIVEGELGETLYLVVDGQVLIHRGKTELGILKARDHFGEMAILDGEPRSASATAKTDCLLLSVNRRDFNDLLTQYNQIAKAVIATLNERLRNTLTLLDAGKKPA